MFKLLVTLVIFESALAGFLNLAQNNDNSGINSNNPTGNYAYQQQVPLTLTPGPSHQSYSAQVSSNQQPLNGQVATSTTYRQQHINSVPSTVTTHGIATSYITVPVHGYYGNDGRTNGNNANNSPANGINSNSVGSSSGNYGYGGYGYSYLSATGNVSPSNNQANNAAGHPYANNQNNQSQNQNNSNGYSH